MSIEAARRVLRNLRDPERGSDQISRDCDEAADTIEALLSMAEGDNSVAAGAGPFDLLPCPFCGFDADLHHVTHWWVSCSNCEVNTCYEATEAEARAAWNRRALSGGTGDVARQDLERMAMRMALQKCAERFREYEAHHRAKPDHEKADRNMSMAVMCEAMGQAPSVPPDDAREAAHEIISDLLSMCDASNWDADGYRDLEYSIRHEVYERLHDFAADWQQRIGALRAVERPADPRGWREAVAKAICRADCDHCGLCDGVCTQWASWLEAADSALSPAPKDREGG